MTTSEITIKVKFPWWAEAYLSLMLFANSFIKIDGEKVANRIVKHTRFS